MGTQWCRPTYTTTAASSAISARCVRPCRARVALARECSVIARNAAGRRAGSVPVCHCAHSRSRRRRSAAERRTKKKNLGYLSELDARCRLDPGPRLSPNWRSVHSKCLDDAGCTVVVRFAWKANDDEMRCRARTSCSSRRACRSSAACVCDASTTRRRQRLHRGDQCGMRRRARVPSPASSSTSPSLAAPSLFMCGAGDNFAVGPRDPLLEQDRA